VSDLDAMRNRVAEAEAQLRGVAEQRRRLAEERAEAEATQAGPAASGLDLPLLLATHEDLGRRVAELDRRAAGLEVAEAAARHRLDGAREALRPLVEAEQRAIAAGLAARQEAEHRRAAAAVAAERARLVAGDPFGGTLARCSTSPGLAVALAQHRARLADLRVERAALAARHPGIELPAVELLEGVLTGDYKQPARPAGPAPGLLPGLPTNATIRPLSSAGRLALDRLEAWGTEFNPTRAG
jgi:hypothetical protein